MYRLASVILPALLILGFAVLPAAAEPRVDSYLELYGGVDYFAWREYSAGGDELLEETGPLVRLGLAGSTSSARQLVLRGRGDLFFGSVDYDGQLQNGTPLSATTDYYGLTLEGETGFLFPMAPVAIEPFFTLGLRGWLRQLDSGGNREYGYDETWATIYAVLGIAGHMQPGSDTSLYGRAGLRMPLGNAESVDLSEQGGPTIDLEPGTAPGLILEGGLVWRQLVTSIYYEEFNFDASDPEFIGGGIFWQPESKCQIVGLRLALRL